MKHMGGWYHGKQKRPITWCMKTWIYGVFANSFTPEAFPKTTMGWDCINCWKGSRSVAGIRMVFVQRQLGHSLLIRKTFFVWDQKNKGVTNFFGPHCSQKSLLDGIQALVSVKDGTRFLEWVGRRQERWNVTCQWLPFLNIRTFFRLLEKNAWSRSYLFPARRQQGTLNKWSREKMEWEWAEEDTWWHVTRP